MTNRTVRRAVMAAVAVGLIVVGWAGSAFAHVEVEADKPQAGATDVTLTFVAESESTKAGIVSLRVVLPAGIPATDVSYVSGPPGWTLTTASDGYMVAGPAVPAGDDATYKVKITKLPSDGAPLAFKTLQTYSDNRVDRWIDLSSPQGAEPANPAPILTVAAAAPVTDPPATTDAAVAAATTGPIAEASAGPLAGDTDPSTSSLWWVVGAMVVLTGVAAAVVLIRRRRVVGASSD